MDHLSFFWLEENKQALLEGIASEFGQRVEQSIKLEQITLPPIPEVVLKLQRLCADPQTIVPDVAECLIEDPSLAAVVIRIANSTIFNRRSIVFTDILTAVSRLGIMRVRDIVTAQAIEQLKRTVDLNKECKQMLVKSAISSKELAATMVLVTQAIGHHSDDQYDYLEVEKALLVGLLADIGLFCLVNEYHLYLESGNYLDKNIALQVFSARCAATTELVLKQWQFDTDFLEVATNKQIKTEREEISYLDIAQMANHLLLFRNQDDAIEEHHVELNLVGAEALYDLSQLSDGEFRTRLNDVINSTGF